MQTEALYPFGYGLSYTTFDYSGATIDKTLLGQEGVTVTVTVKNTGCMAGAETVQAYVKVNRENTPNAQLKGIKKLYLEPGESKTVTLRLPLEAFALYDEEGVLRLKEGNVTLYVGGHAPDARSTALTGTKVMEWKLEIKENKVLE